MSVLPFPSTPDDPFTRRLGASPPPSPFRATDGTPPPVLAGRHAALQAAADLLARLVDHRSGGVGLHGPTGIGKTALLDHIETQVLARGGVVVRLDGTDLDGAAGQLAHARDQLLATADPADPAAIDAGSGIAGTYRAAATAARRPLVVRARE